MYPTTTTPRSSLTLAAHSEKDDSIKVTPPRTPIHQNGGTPNGALAFESEETFVDWDGPNDPENPFNFPLAKKWRVTLFACFMTFVVQINGTMMTSAAEQINESFHISDEHFPHSYWPVLSWNLGGAAAPLLGLPLMENFGVRWSYLVRMN